MKGGRHGNITTGSLKLGEISGDYLVQVTPKKGQ